MTAPKTRSEKAQDRRTLRFGTRWTVFGPLDRKTPAPAAVRQGRIPETLKRGTTTLPARVAVPRRGVLDLKPMLGGADVDRAALVFIPVEAPETAEYEIGIGADWWFAAWIDGQVLGDTLSEGNEFVSPSVNDHQFKVTLNAGRHVLAIRFISGSAGALLAVGAPDRTVGEIREQVLRKSMGFAKAVMRPLKVVFLGAGSGFLQPLFTDVLNIPGADRGELALVDVDGGRLQLAEQLCRKMVEKSTRNWRITAATERKQVLRGAHYIINCIEVSGVHCVAWDNDIPLKYGIDQCIGDTAGPGGLFKALRTVPVFLDMLRDVERLCPEAWVLNYTNPMSIMCLAAARASSAHIIGLCHSVQGASHALAGWAGVPYEELRWDCAGINHLAWFTTYSHQGKDLYSALKDRVQKDRTFAEQDLVRFDLMRNLGYYCTESSGHDSEYLPYYRKNPAIMKRYCRDGYLGGSRFYAGNWPAWRKGSDQKRRDQISGRADLPVSRRGFEYASYIIEAMETNAPMVIYGSMPNHGLISNLPQDGVVEVACLVNRNGIHGTHFGALAPQCAALCDWNMRFYDLAAKACIEKSKEAAAHALMLDPLTAAVSCPTDIRRMTEEMFRAEKAFLPGYR